MMESKDNASTVAEDSSCGGDLQEMQEMQKILPRSSTSEEQFLQFLHIPPQELSLPGSRKDTAKLERYVFRGHGE